ncbi:MAG: glycosyltransferase [Armatimonadota bacterium]
MIAQWLLPALLVQCVILLVNLWHWKRRRVPLLAGSMSHLPKVSVLIPVRNERHRLPALVQMLRCQKPAPFEIILCDDSSEDGSTEWLRKNLPAHHPGEPLSWFPAPPKPPEWVGKNWACHQLGSRAQGEWLLFLDADITLNERSIASLVQALEGCHQAQLVTAIPSLRPNTIAVGLLKLMVPFSVFTLLPLALAEKHPHPAFGFANGQVMAFPREYYQQVQPHRLVRNAVLEDVWIARAVKKLGGRVCILDGRALFRVSMYNTMSQAVDGFSKNGVAICGSIAGAVVVAFALPTVYLLPLVEGLLVGHSVWHGADYLLSTLLFGMSGWMAGMPLWYGLLYPLSILIGEWVLWRSISWYSRGKVLWKGRVYPVR